MKLLAFISAFTGFLLGLSLGTDFPFLEGIFANWSGSLLLGITSGILTSIWWAHTERLSQKFDDQKAAAISILAPAFECNVLYSNTGLPKAISAEKANEMVYGLKQSGHNMRDLGFNAAASSLYGASEMVEKSSLKDVSDFHKTVEKCFVLVSDLRFPFMYASTCLAVKAFFRRMRK